MAQLQANKKVIGGGVLALALMAAIPFIGDHEGDRLSSYKDVVGVWTICEGVTGKLVHAGEKLTNSQCDELDKSEIGQFMTQVASNLTVEVSPLTLAAHTSFAYNIGISGYKRSKTLRLTNEGQPRLGCQAMANWKIAGGLDCSIKANGCYGLVKRRNDEINLCLSGIQNQGQ